jgi:hypothetical protein
MAGKGDTPRPVNLATYEANYEEIFRSCRLIPEQRVPEENENGATSYATQDSAQDEGNSSPVAQTRLT